jgi:PTS system fructose-specific IIC component
MIGGLAAGYIVLAIKQIPIRREFRGLMPVLVIPLLGTLAIGVLMNLVIGPPATWLNETMTKALETLSTGNKLILAILMGLMMAFDMGGPVNKAAYFFGLAASSNGNWVPIAAVMVAGMTPPLGLALAMLINKNKFSALEREGLSGCFIGAASFITEFAIPYAAADPFRVIPSLMVGSAVGSAMSILFNISLQAPHGGLFVIMLANKPFLWLLSIIVGGFVTAGMLLVLKPNLAEAEEESTSLEGVAVA